MTNVRRSRRPLPLLSGTDPIGLHKNRRLAGGYIAHNDSSGPLFDFRYRLIRMCRIRHQTLVDTVHKQVQFFKSRLADQHFVA